MTDAFGESLIAYYCRDYFCGERTRYIVRRDDGLCESQNVGVYFDEYPAWQDFEKEIIDYTQGRVLDLGAGAGRHTLYLQLKSHEVHAVDISEGALLVMKKRGVKNLWAMDLRKLEFPENHFDSVLMLFNNFGLAGGLKETRDLLEVLYKISTKKGRIIATTRDPYQTEKPEHLVYHERNRKAGRPPGLIRIRIEYQEKIGDWFDLLMVSPCELKELLIGTGWMIAEGAPGPNGMYGVVLEKRWGG